MAIVKRGKKYCVTDSAKKKTLGCHPTRKAALNQLRAIEANKKSRGR